MDKITIQNLFLDKNNKLSSTKFSRNVNKIKNLGCFTPKEKLYIMYNEIKDTHCIYCLSEKKFFISFPKGFKPYCNNKVCRNKNKKIQLEKTNIEKYGVKSNLNLDSCKTARNNALIKKYGACTPFGDKNIKEQIKENYKINKDVINDKTKYTKLEKYGNENFNNRKKMNKTCIEKYGENWQKKFVKSGIDSPKVSHYTNLDKFFDSEFIIKKFVTNKYFLQEEFMEFFNCSYSVVNRKKRELNITKPVKFNRFKTHNKIYNWLSEYDNILFNDRQIIKPLELDLFSEKYKFAIEYDGLMFHSYGISNNNMFNNLDKINKNKHLNKTLLCNEKNIQLFHIFENEWKDPKKQKIWKSLILNKIGNSVKIGARKCVIKEVKADEARTFIDNNHLQGYRKAKHKIGLYYEEELVSIMTFGIPLYNKECDIELYRFCSKLGFSIQGGASKLLSYFKKNYIYNNLLSYANLRWSEGNVYKKLGFKFIENTPPNFFWFKVNENILYTREKFQKHKLSNLLTEFDKDKTADLNMFLSNYRKIYDCGNKKYILKLNC